MQAPPHGERECLFKCQNAGVCNRDTGLCDCIAGVAAPLTRYSQTTAPPLTCYSLSTAARSSFAFDSCSPTFAKQTTNMSKQTNISNIKHHEYTSNISNVFAYTSGCVLQGGVLLLSADLPWLIVGILGDQLLCFTSFSRSTGEFT